MYMELFHHLLGSPGAVNFGSGSVSNPLDSINAKIILCRFFAIVITHKLLLQVHEVTLNSNAKFF